MVSMRREVHVHNWWQALPGRYSVRLHVVDVTPDGQRVTALSYRMQGRDPYELHAHVRQRAHDLGMLYGVAPTINIPRIEEIRHAQD